MQCLLALLPYHVLRSWSDSPGTTTKSALPPPGYLVHLAHEGTQCPIRFTDDEVQKHEQENCNSIPNTRNLIPLTILVVEVMVGCPKMGNDYIERAKGQLG